MAEETSTPVPEVTTSAPAPDVTLEQKAVEPPPLPEPTSDTPATDVTVEETAVAAASSAADAGVSEEAAAAARAEVDPGVLNSVSFKEESNIVADLPDPEKVALDELKNLIHDALATHAFAIPPPPPASKPEEETPAVATEKPAAAADAAVQEMAVLEAEEPKITSETSEPVLQEIAVSEAEEPKITPETSAPVETVAPPPEEVKLVIVEKEGEKTVEAIEESIVPTAAPEAAEDVHIWGVPLLGEEKSDTVLLKFLRARDFKPKDALAMIKHAVIWRKQFGIDDLLGEELGVAPEIGEKVVFMHGVDKEGHPVCYNVYGEFQDKELYGKVFGDEEKREKFLKWRIQFLEKGIRQMLDFSPGSVCTMVQVTDLKNLPGPGKRELRQATRKALALLQDSYPEFVAKQIFINVPWWYLAYYRTIGSIFTPRSKSKFVFAGPSSSTDTLFKYIAPEQVPVQYGGLSKDDTDFTTADAATDVTIKPASKHTIEIPVTEGTTLVWELRVLGWDVSYGAEFVPSAEGGYTIIVAKAKKFVATDEAVVKSSFKINEPGKVVLTIDNASSKKKKLLYRSKVKSD